MGTWLMMKKIKKCLLLAYFLTLFLPYARYPRAEDFKFVTDNAFEALANSPFLVRRAMMLCLLGFALLVYLITKFFKKEARQSGIVVLLTSFIWLTVMQLTPTILSEPQVLWRFYGIGFWSSSILGCVYLILELRESGLKS
jgi:hypothetical protein